ncbi:MAG: hypothetical protein ACKVW3_02935 [Phycisphaerales bacterium]
MMRITFPTASFSFACVALLLALQVARAQPCQVGWSAAFPTNDLSGEVRAWARFDDGTGAAVYAGGYFSFFGGGPNVNVAKWTAAGWKAVGIGPNNRVNAMLVFDGGTGPKLFAAGEFTTAGGAAASRIAVWNGLNWSPVGTGFNATVRALVAFNDGTGQALYAAGDFTQASGSPANRVAKWTGTSWVALGQGTNGTVRALTVFDPGSGSRLYAGGDFIEAGGLATSYMASWNGVNWFPLGGNIPGSGVSVRALLGYDDGSGPALYIGGNFSIPQPFGEPVIYGIGRWNGAWSTVGTGVGPASGFGGVHTLALADFGAGPRLFAGGLFSRSFPTIRNISSWDGSEWSSMSAGPFSNEYVFSIQAIDLGQGTRVYVGGNFSSAGPFRTANLTSWNGSEWLPLGNGADSPVDAMLAVEEGSGTALYVGGRFLSVGQTEAVRIARWDGSVWSPLGTGLTGEPAPEPTVAAIARFDDGTGPAIYAAGRFDTAGGVSANNIAKWNGVAWQPLGPGINGLVLDLAVFNDGSGPSLFAAGSFSTAGTTSAQHIAKWNGTSWSRLTNPGLSGTAKALLVFDDGTGPALYVGGDFATAGEAPVANIAKWNGTSWTSLALGFDNGVDALATYDDGVGSALYAGGRFGFTGAQPLSNIARWRAGQWSALATGISGQVSSLTAFDDGTGSSLFAGGNFASAGTVTSPFVIRWNRTQFLAVGPGTTGPVSSLATLASPSPALIVGGAFRQAGDVSSGNLARYQGCLPCYANCDESTIAPILNINDFICFLIRFAQDDPWANCDGSTLPPVLNINDFACFLGKYAVGCP